MKSRLIIISDKEYLIEANLLLMARHERINIFHGLGVITLVFITQTFNFLSWLKLEAKLEGCSMTFSIRAAFDFTSKLLGNLIGYNKSETAAIFVDIFIFLLDETK